jgi:hypothetical protein
VLGKKWQYSSLAAPSDPQLLKYPLSSDPSFQECIAIALAVLVRSVPNPFPGADSYHDGSIKPPAWTLTAHMCGSATSPHGNTLFFYDVDHDYERATTGHV